MLGAHGLYFAIFLDEGVGIASRIVDQVSGSTDLIRSTVSRSVAARHLFRSLGSDQLFWPLMFSFFTVHIPRLIRRWTSAIFVCSWARCNRPRLPESGYRSIGTIKMPCRISDLSYEASTGARSARFLLKPTCGNASFTQSRKCLTAKQPRSQC